MKNVIISLLLSFLLIGCGVSIGPNNAIRNATIGELLVATKLSRSASREDFLDMLDRFVTKVPFDASRTLGNGLNDCNGISNKKISMEKYGSDSSYIKLEFNINKTTKVELYFLGRSFDILYISLIQNPLYFMKVNIINEDKVIYEDASEKSLDMLFGLSVTCNLINIVNKKIEFKKQIKALEEKKEQMRGNLPGNWEQNPELSNDENKIKYDEFVKRVEKQISEFKDDGSTESGILSEKVPIKSKLKKTMIGDLIDNNPNAQPNGVTETKKRDEKKQWQDENGFIHYPDGSISSGPVD